MSNPHRSVPHPVQRQRRSLALLSLAILTFCAAALTPGPSDAHLDVWVDPGHGGDDPGAVGWDGPGDPDEKDLTLAVCQFLEVDLLGLGMFSRLMINSDSTYITPETRAAVANGTETNDQGFMDTCSLLISVHMNSVVDSTRFGTETYFSKAKGGAKIDTAYVADSLAAATIHPDVVANANLAFLGCSNNRGLKNGSHLAVLRLTDVEAVLIEVCFISNFCQFTNISTSGDQALISDGIAAGASSVIFAPSAHPRRGPPAVATDELRVPSTATRLARAQVLQEGFEGATFPPTGWSVQTAGEPVPHAWHRSTHPEYVANGLASAVVGGESANAIDEWLISPAVTLAATDDAISFLWASNPRYASDVNATCNIRLDGTATWTQLWSLSSEPLSDPFLYRERVADISAWTGMDVEFGFNVVGINGADFELDDVVVGDFEPTTTPTNDLCANATPLTTPFDIQDVTCYAANELDPFMGPGVSCVGNPLGGRDIYYELSVAAGDTLVASFTASWGMGLYVIDDCVTATCLAGAYREDAVTLPEIEYEFPTAGTYYLVVDGETNSCGPFQLTGEIRPTAVSVIEPPQVVEDRLRLTVLPNPTAGAVLIRGRLSGASVASLAIYDVAGKKLVAADVAVAGDDLTFQWDGRDAHGNRVGAGTYFVRVRAGSRVLEEKITLLR